MDCLYSWIQNFKFSRKLWLTFQVLIQLDDDGRVENNVPDHTHHLTFGCVDSYREKWLMTSTVSWKVASANAAVISTHPHMAKTSSKLHFPFIQCHAEGQLITTRWQARPQKVDQLQVKWTGRVSRSAWYLRVQVQTGFSEPREVLRSFLSQGQRPWLMDSQLIHNFYFWKDGLFKSLLFPWSMSSVAPKPVAGCATFILRYLRNIFESGSSPR